MATNLSIGLYHPSEKLSVDVFSQLSFITTTPQCFPQKIVEFYPDIVLPIRSYLVSETQFKESTAFINNLTGTGYPALKKHAKSNKVELVFNELFNIDGNLKSGITEFKIISYLETILDIFPNVEIIFNEMNTYRITHYTGNGFQDNGVLRLIQKVQDKFPDASFSLGVQTIGNKLCKDLILKSLPLVLSYIKNLDWFSLPIHFTEVGYYHDPYNPKQQTFFLDEIKHIAIDYEIASLCYIYPWDGDYFHLPGQPRNSICGIWDDNWNVKYDFLH